MMSSVDTWMWYIVNIHNTHVLPRRIEVVAAYMRV